LITIRLLSPSSYPQKYNAIGTATASSIDESEFGVL